MLLCYNLLPCMYLIAYTKGRDLQNSQQLQWFSFSLCFQWPFNCLVFDHLQYANTKETIDMQNTREVAKLFLQLQLSNEDSDQNWPVVVLHDLVVCYHCMCCQLNNKSTPQNIKQCVCVCVCVCENYKCASAIQLNMKFAFDKLVLQTFVFSLR